MRLLEDGRDAATAGLLITAHLRPVPRVALGRLMYAAGVTGAMDLSDGLAGDLRKILEASRVSAAVEIDRLPVLPAVRALFPDQWKDLAIRGGEDYELLMTIPEDRFRDFVRMAEQVGATVTAIGRLVEAEAEPDLVFREDGIVVDVIASSWDHFGHG